MQHAAMLNVRFRAELLPDGDRLSYRRSNVIRDVGIFVTHQFVPPVFVFLTDICATRVVMLFPKVQRIDATAATVNDGVAQCACERIVTAPDEYGVARVRFDLDAKLNGGRMILIFSP